MSVMSRVGGFKNRNIDTTCIMPIFDMMNHARGEQQNIGTIKNLNLGCSAGVHVGCGRHAGPGGTNFADNAGG